MLPYPRGSTCHQRPLLTIGLEVFIHYLPRDDPEPEEGFEENAFPELILGDFGHAAMNGDALAMVQPGCWDEPSVIAEWQ